MSRAVAPLSPEDRAIAAAYLDDPARQIRRQRRITVQYALGAGAVMGVALWADDVRLAVPVYLLLVLWLVLRQRALERRTRALRRILAAYDAAADDSPPAG